MFKRILIANRGEVAIRIIRACWEMDIETVAIFSSEDRNSLHVKFADFAVCIGPARASKSYLNIDAIITTAKQFTVDAIHPGYGFLSESSEFAKACISNGITFIGPSPDAISLLGDKIHAKQIAKKLNIPIIPGKINKIDNYVDAHKSAEKLGYPVLIKASNGGGGKGIRKLNSSDDFDITFSQCIYEAKNSFYNCGVYIEKYLCDTKHIEVQVLADSYGNVLILGDRDCSFQSGNQKLIEESPANILSDEIRQEIHEYSRKITIYTNYTNAGTVEFLLDKNKNIYFLEINTRLQVEHPVTEAVTGIDIVKEQIKIAYGNPLSITQDQIKINGHAMECRINANINMQSENPQNFIVKNYHIPGGVGIRVDSLVYTGMNFSAVYDSNIAKLIAYGKNRDECIKIMQRGLCEFIIDGIDTNIELLLHLINSTFFKSNCHNINTYNEIKNKIAGVNHE